MDKILHLCGIWWSSTRKGAASASAGGSEVAIDPSGSLIRKKSWMRVRQGKQQGQTRKHNWNIHFPYLPLQWLRVTCRRRWHQCYGAVYPPGSRLWGADGGDTLGARDAAGQAATPGQTREEQHICNNLCDLPCSRCPPWTFGTMAVASLLNSSLVANTSPEPGRKGFMGNVIPT